MRSMLCLPVAAAFMLAACGDKADDAAEGDAMSEADLAAASQDVVMARPGQYTSTSEIVAFEVPGLGQEMASQLKAQMQQGAGQESSFCLTEEQAARGREEMLRNVSESNCNVTRFDASGGSIDAAMQCQGEAGLNGDVTVTGTMGEEASDIVMDFNQSLPGMEPAHIKMRVKSRRVGECG